MKLQSGSILTTQAYWLICAFLAGTAVASARYGDYGISAGYSEAPQSVGVAEFFDSTSRNFIAEIYDGGQGGSIYGGAKIANGGSAGGNISATISPNPAWSRHLQASAWAVEGDPDAGMRAAAQVSYTDSLEIRYNTVYFGEESNPNIDLWAEIPIRVTGAAGDFYSLSITSNSEGVSLSSDGGSLGGSDGFLAAGNSTTFLRIKFTQHTFRASPFGNYYYDDLALFSASVSAGGEAAGAGNGNIAVAYDFSEIRLFTKNPNVVVDPGVQVTYRGASSFFESSSFSANFVEITNPTFAVPVPEPTFGSLVAAAAVVLLFTGRKRRAALSFSFQS